MSEPQELVDVYAGSVVWFDVDRGYGFIEADGAPRGSKGVFLHAKYILNDWVPQANDRVMFWCEWERDRWSARDVEPLSIPETVDEAG
jgi:cold shock CspA family protein